MIVASQKIFEIGNIMRQVAQVDSIRLIELQTSASTNSDLVHAVQNGQSSIGDLFWTQQQTSGRGRLNRKWIAPQGNLSFSIALPLPQIPKHIPILNFVTALAVCDTIEHIHAIRAQIKWPNDILIHNLKICGILGEIIDAKSAVVGVGLNLNSTRCAFPHELQTTITTLIDATRTHTDPRFFLEQFVHNLKLRWDQFSHRATDVITAVSTRLAWMGQPIRIIESTNQSTDGILLGLDDSGHLVTVTQNGCLNTWLAGDISLKEKP